MSRTIRTATPIALVLLVGTLTSQNIPSALCQPCTPKDGGTLAGRVFEWDTPVPFANVVLPDLRMGVVADELGCFTLPGLPVGEHRIRVMMVGLEPVEGTFTIRAGETTSSTYRFIRSRVEGVECIELRGSIQAAANAGVRQRPSHAVSSCHPRADRRLIARGSTPTPNLQMTVEPDPRTVPECLRTSAKQSQWTVDLGPSAPARERSSRAWHFLEPLG